MPRFDHHPRFSITHRLASPAAVLGACLTAALGLAMLPPAVSQWLRCGWREALRPGLIAIGSTADWLHRDSATHSHEEQELREARQQIADLQETLRHRELELMLTHSDIQHQGEHGTVDAMPGGTSENAPADAAALPLVVPQIVSARVLGRQAQSLLQGCDLLDVGRSRGAAVQALVIDDSSAIPVPLVLDRGKDSSIAVDRLVLAGSRVWGKVAEVGQHTCTVKRTTDAGFRELVQLAAPREGRLQFAARGVLVGQGQPLCKIEQVATTEPIAVGDLAFTVDDGVVDSPLLYGRVVRVGRKPGQSHWEIWLEPAVPEALPPARVAVLKMELNPTRLAAAPP